MQGKVEELQFKENCTLMAICFETLLIFLEVNLIQASHHVRLTP